MLEPLALTGNVATFSGGARLPRMTGPRKGGKGHQSPTTAPAGQHKKTRNMRKRREDVDDQRHRKGCTGHVPVSRLNALLWRGHTIVEPSPSLHRYTMTKGLLERRRVPRGRCTLDARVPAVLERSAQVGAAVGDGEDLSVQVRRNQQRQAVNLNRDQVTGGNIVGLQHGNPLLLRTC